MSTTQHPLTEAAAVELWEERCGYRFTDNTLAALRAAFNAGREHERTTPEDARPWEPLEGPVRVGDEVRRELKGITSIAVVGRVDEGGDPWAAEGGLIGLRDVGTWYVRRTAPELPTEDGAVIVRKGERIEARHAGKTWVATEAVLVDGEWRGTWFEKGRATGDWNVMWAMSPDRITPRHLEGGRPVNAAS